MTNEPVPSVAAAATSAITATAGFSLTGLSVEWLGVPLAVLLLGFAGAMAALSFLPLMPRRRAFVAVLIGTVAASSSTPLIAHLFGLPPAVEKGTAFFAGLFAHLLMTWAFVHLPAIIGRRLGGDQ